MEQKNMTSVRELFEQMSTEQLDVLLDRELHSDQIDDGAVRMILSILREREKDEPVELTPELEEAWEKYRQEITQIDRQYEQKARRKRFALRAASVAAVLVLLLTVIPQQAGAESFWDRLTRWTAGIVEFFSPEDNEHRILEYEFKTNNLGLQQVYDTVVEMGITVPVVPMWLPDGYVLVELFVDNLPASTVIYSRFSNAESEIVFKVEKYDTTVSTKYQKDESVIDRYENNGVTHYIMRNIDQLVVVWEKDSIECSIFADCQEDALNRVLKSIYIVEAET